MMYVQIPQSVKLFYLKQNNINIIFKSKVYITRNNTKEEQLENSYP